MEKEICILKNFRNILDATTDTDCSELDKAIATIEEALKPKSCDSCRSKFCSIKRILLERDEINSSYFYCNDYEPKENA